MSFKSSKEKFILLGGTIGIGMISLVITMAVYNLQLSNIKNPEEEKKNIEVVKDDIKFNLDLTEAQKKVAQNLLEELDKLEKKSNESNNIKEDKTVDDIKKDDLVEVAAQVKKDISFIKPVEGNFGMIYADEKLVYSKTLNEWLTHKAIDILADIDSVVVASANGKVIDIFNDKKYGFTIIIEHDDGYISKYSGVNENTLVKVGDNVKQGDAISKIALPSGFEVEEGSHLHFELLKDGINLNPDFI